MTIDIAAPFSPEARQGDTPPPLPLAGPRPQGDARRPMASSAARMVGAWTRHRIVEWIGGATVGTDVAASAIGAAGDIGSGDWADIIARPHGGASCSIMIGDAMGSGASAAPSGRLLRLSARAFLDCSHHAAPMITALDRLVARWDDTIATCLSVDIGSGQVVAHSAGHPPPLIIDDRGVAQLLRVPTAGPLGLGASCAAAAYARIAPGTTVVMYTDGLIQRRRLPIDDGLRWLLAASGGMHVLPVEVVAHQLLQQSVELSPAEDDITVVAARVK
jgi:serine phosphatase RsbU (regulator of sigma subunit)